MRRFRFTRRRVVVLLAITTLYGLLWWLTAIFGAPATRAVAFQAMDVPADWLDVSSREAADLYHERYKYQPPGTWHTYSQAPPSFYCRASAYAPFLVRIDYGWATGPARGEFGSVWYLWVFGAVVRGYEWDHGSI